MNKLFVSLPLVLLALVLPASASAGGSHAPGGPAENQIYCGPDADCPPPTEICDISTDEDHPVPAQENCIWPEDPPCVIGQSDHEGVPVECFSPEEICEMPVISEDGPPKGLPDTGENGPPEPGACEFPAFPPDYCYFEGAPGAVEGSEPGESEAVAYSDGGRYPSGFEGPDPGHGSGDPGNGTDDPGEWACAYELSPPAQETGNSRAEVRRQRAQARRQAARKRAQVRRQAARKRAAAKRQKLKAKKAAQGRNR